MRTRIRSVVVVELVKEVGMESINNTPKRALKTLARCHYNYGAVNYGGSLT